MIKFLMKGIIRDRNRSLLPVIIITIGVTLTVFMSGFMKGIFSDMIVTSANFDTGHMKVMTKSYADNIDQLPIDLAMLDVNEMITDLETNYPDVEWVKRTKFGGLIDVLDADGNSKGQGPAAGMAYELIDADNHEMDRIDFEKSLVRGSLIQNKGEAIIGDDFATRLNVKLGEEITYFGSTMNGSMTFYNFTVVGTIKFGVGALDQGAIVIDMQDLQTMLDMNDASSEVLGFLPKGIYNEEKVEPIVADFNAKHADPEDEFAPIMLSLADQNGLREMIQYSNSISSIIISLFVIAMSIVLWNTGLLGGLRRYQEFGIRLALGERKAAIYGSQIMEAVLVGIIGSVIGTIFGLSLVFYLQYVGLDLGSTMQDTQMFIPTVIRAKFSPSLLYVGFIPGLLAMVLGTMLSGIGIFRRSTASLFKELEV